MSKWTNATLTADGQNLQAQLLDGGGFEFTKVTAADSSGTDKLTLTMQPSVIAGKTITVPVLLSNSNLSAGFTMNQLKFYARKTGIPAGDEIVYAIAEDETGDEIPSESDSPGFTIDWSYTFQFGNATSVNVSIDPAGLVSMALLGSPGGIATLNNAGAVPIEQGGTGAVTASAALAALGGMRASATGDDIPTSASDPTSISSQLSNSLKTSGNQTVVGLIASKYQSSETGFASVTGTSNNSFFEWYRSFETYAAERSQLILGKPVTGGMPSLQLSQTLDGQEFDIFDVAIATPPQKFTAPLSDGYSGSLVYLKTQENIVIVSFDVYKTDNSSINGVNLIGTLPEGFRGISGYCAALAMGVGEGSIVGAAQAWCHTDGSIQTLCPSGTYRIRGEIIFCAN